MLKPKLISIVSVFASWVLLMVASPPLLAQTDADSRAAPGDVVGDLDGDDDVDLSDLGILLADWGCTADCVGDVDGDDDVDQADLGLLLADWG
ncbi:MAG TPA: hypothetical protein VM243_00815 [Phycisphaerae bacterium]|nr:hypothetical protein [Phycisphaerae bacterium]